MGAWVLINDRWYKGKWNGPEFFFGVIRGSRYEGDFIDGRKTGKGKWTGQEFLWGFIKSSRYEGDFINDRRTGKGTVVWANGDRYEGHFHNDAATGKGTLIRADGARYVGEVVMGKPHGIGKLFFKKKEIYSGIWEQGCLRDSTTTTPDDRSTIPFCISNAHL